MHLTEICEALRALYQSLSNREVKELAIREFERLRTGEMVAN